MKTTLITPVFSISSAMLWMAQRCMDSLVDDRPDELIVVDDASWLPFTWQGRVDKLIRNDVNSGYVKTVNAGLRAATGDVIIIGNSDLTFSRGWLRAILDPLSDHDICALRTSEVLKETEDKIEEDGRFGPLFAMRRSVYEKLGPLDERYVHFCSDNDYRRRAIAAEMKMCINHRFIVGHVGDATYGQTDPKHVRFKADRDTFVKLHGYVD